MIHGCRGKRGEQAYILIWVLFYFVLFALLALAFMDDSMLEGMISINHYRDVQAFAMADGGASMGAEQIYAILNRDYRNSQEIPEEIILDQQEWAFNAEGSDVGFLLENPRRISEDDGACCFQFTSQGDCDAAQKKIQVEVRVKYTDCYLIQYAADGTAIITFDHRDFTYPAQITSLKI